MRPQSSMRTPGRRLPLLVPDGYDERVHAPGLVVDHELGEDDSVARVQCGVADVVLAGAVVRGVDDELAGLRVVGRGGAERLDVGAVAGLGHREAPDEPAVDQVLEVGVVVRLGAELQDRATEEPELHPDLDDHRQVAVRQRLEGGDRRADVGSAAVLLGEPEAGLPGVRHQLDDLEHPLAEVVLGHLVGVVEDRGVLGQVLADEVADVGVATVEHGRQRSDVERGSLRFRSRRPWETWPHGSRFYARHTVAVVTVRDGSHPDDEVRRYPRSTRCRSGRTPPVRGASRIMPPPSASATWWMPLGAPLELQNTRSPGLGGADRDRCAASVLRDRVVREVAPGRGPAPMVSPEQSHELGSGGAPLVGLAELRLGERGSPGRRHRCARAADPEAEAVAGGRATTGAWCDPPEPCEPPRAVSARCGAPAAAFASARALARAAARAAWRARSSARLRAISSSAACRCARQRERDVLSAASSLTSWSLQRSDRVWSAPERRSPRRPPAAGPARPRPARSRLLGLGVLGLRLEHPGQRLGCGVALVVGLQRGRRALEAGVLVEHAHRPVRAHHRLERRQVPTVLVRLRDQCADAAALRPDGTTCALGVRAGRPVATLGLLEPPHRAVVGLRRLLGRQPRRPRDAGSRRPAGP